MLQYEIVFLTVIMVGKGYQIPQVSRINLLFNPMLTKHGKSNNYF